MHIPLCKPFFDSSEVTNIKKVLDSGWVSQGPMVKEFEDKVKDFLGVKYTVAVVNCTSALHLSLLSLSISQGDEVLVGDYTFPSTGHAVVYCGGRPIFVDVSPRSFNIDPSLINGKVTNKSKAVIPVHTFGQPCDMDMVMSAAKEYGLYVVEDAACAFGAKYKDRFAGTIGDVGCFSFHARKGITTGEGGMVVTNNKKIAERVRCLSTFGMSSAWERENNVFVIPVFNDVGYNYKMSDITAAVGISQLSKLRHIIEYKQRLAKYYDKCFRSFDYLSVPYVSEDVEHVYQSYVVLVDKKIDRNLLITKLRARGIQCQIGTYASHIQPVYRSVDMCPVSLDVFHRTLALPMYYDMTTGDVDRVVGTVRTVLNEGGVFLA